ncbi:MAG: NUDIX hydrolase N-terminal domain-containing protein [Anaerolineales bacterium]
MKLAERLAAWADRLRDVSARGLHFADNPYDRENYRVVQDVALDLLATAVDEAPESLEPLRATVFSCPTPFAVGDAAIIDAHGRILLIRRADNGLWAMPGGALEVGETPAQGVEREALEETGLRCRAQTLVGVYDSRYCGSLTRHHLYHFTFLCVPLEGEEPGEGSHALEVLDVRWFPEAALPGDLDPGHVTRIPTAFRAWHQEGPAFFDGSTDPSLAP